MNKKKKQILLLLLTLCLLVYFIILFFKQYNEDWLSEYGKEQLNNTSSITPFPTQIIKPTEEAKNEGLAAILPSDTFDEITIKDPIDNTADTIDNLPHDKLFITVERQNYKSDELTLIIPKLNLIESIKDGTDDESLNKGPGLYDYSQLPGEGNRNVSIAGHRNTSRNGVIGEWFFYYIDKLTTNDYLYLVYDNNIYQYVYDQTTIIDAYDWGPIYSQGFSCLTLTSCEPIGISTHRIVVRSKLINIYPYSDDFNFEGSAQTN